MGKFNISPSPFMNSRVKYALFWILDILDKNNIPYKITGGLAALCHGVNRAIADIDIEIDDKYMPIIEKEVRLYIVFGPDRYIDEEWDIELIELVYHDQDIDIGGVVAKVFNPKTGIWEDSISDLDDYDLVNIYGREVRIQTIDGLIAYKSQLCRDVDVEDIRQLQIIKETVINY